MTRRPVQAWLAAIAATTCLVLVVGGITRLTQSGLSIVDWQPLIGVVPPLTESQCVDSFARYQQFPEYRQLRPQMTLAEYKQIFFWEYLHRLIARLIGLVFLVPVAVFYWSGALPRPTLHRAVLLFVLGALQGVAWWFMVRSGLIDRPSVSHYRLALHLMLALAIVCLCVWMIRDLGAESVRRTTPDRYPIWAWRALSATLILQIIWGAFVAGLKAGYAFNTFPLMGGTLVPSAFWTLHPAVLNLVQTQSGVQWMHRLLGTALLIAAGVFHVRMRQSPIDRASLRVSLMLLCAIATQYLLGILTLVYGVPIALALLHQALAAAIVCLWVVMAWDVHQSFRMDYTVARVGTG